MKGLFFFGIAFVAACVVLLTFMQQPFQTQAHADLLWYKTPDIPVYYFLIGAFVLGLLFGLVALLYYWGSLSMALRDERRKVKRLQDEMETVRTSVSGEHTPPEAAPGNDDAEIA
jgi:hypothetical protein